MPRPPACRWTRWPRRRPACGRSAVRPGPGYPPDPRYAPEPGYAPDPRGGYEPGYRDPGYRDDRRYDRGYDPRYDKRRKRKESWLEDLFDFG
ncbi:hypothetical protein [Cellulomonas denverensis]|uniref:hypothetical protein n=1 Tax=Cellulomonas denverensis TaxID=264297 RepID=UPI0035EE22F0